jgi:tetratricopeptide (TPR) repeat protein
MKHQFLVLLACLLSVSAIGQKKELKVAEKLLKKGQFSESLTQLKTVESLLDAADFKTKAKYFYVRAKSFYANGTQVENDGKTAEALSDLLAYEQEIKKSKYSKEAEKIAVEIVQRSVQKGSDSYSAKNYSGASKSFELAYSLSKRDTSFLENAALSSYFAKEYDRSIKLYDQLLKMGYTGITTRYKATSVVNGKDIYFNTKKEMDTQVAFKTAENPEVIVAESRTGQLAKNIALSYIAKGDEKAALEAIANAKKIYPEDYTLVISEANIYFELGNNEKFLEGLKKAITIKPNDPLLHYNVGVITMDQGFAQKAIAHFEKAIELKPDYSDAYNNIGAAIIEKTKPIVEEMNNNLSNFDKYDALLLKQKAVYREALPYYEKAYEYNPKSADLVRTLASLYEILEMYDKQKEMRTRLESM